MHRLLNPRRFSTSTATKSDARSPESEALEEEDAPFVLAAEHEKLPRKIDSPRSSRKYRDSKSKDRDREKDKLDRVELEDLVKDERVELFSSESVSPPAIDNIIMAAPEIPDAGPKQKKILKKSGLLGLWDSRRGSKSKPPAPCAQVFGAPLDVVAARDGWAAPGRLGLPALVRSCIEYIESHGGLDQVGLYRVPGQRSVMEAARAQYDHGEDPFLPGKALSPTDVPQVASVLKLYLRELPAPILPPSTTNSLYSALRTSVDAARDTLAELPRCNYTLLGWILRHLSHVVAHADQNKMPLHNLAIVFSPTLRMPLELLQMLLDQTDELFPDINFNYAAQPTDAPVAADSAKDCEDIVPALHTDRVAAEIAMLEGELAKYHALLATTPQQPADKMDEMWALQRSLTTLKRELKQMTKPVEEPAQSSSIASVLLQLLRELLFQHNELVAVNKRLQDNIHQENARIAALQERLHTLPPEPESPAATDAVALSRQLRDLEKQHTLLTSSTHQLAKECYAAIHTCVGLRVQINLASQQPPAFSRRWAYRALEDVPARLGQMQFSEIADSREDLTLDANASDRDIGSDVAEADVEDAAPDVAIDRELDAGQACPDSEVVAQEAAPDVLADDVFADLHDVLSGQPQLSP
eukprot:m.245621 g.245621  ORF g.245621 m.245621 type:complete len:642 (-) comp14748_c0_seq1:382-2307(-)